MRLGIISDAHHYYDAQGRLATLSPLVRQFEQWAALFDEVTICAPLLHGLPPGTHTPYQVANIKLLSISKAGGNGIWAKANLVWKVKDWWLALRQLLREVDAVHIRCPNNISILGLIALLRSNCHRQALFTGTWLGYPGEPITYRWQRWFLKNHFRGPVAVYGNWPNQPPHIVSSFSPSYSEADWILESGRIANNLDHLAALRTLPQPLQLLTVGSLSRNKNQQLVIRSVRLLKDIGIEAELHVLGDGELRMELQGIAQNLGVEGQVHFHGRTPYDKVRQFYREADFVVQAPLAEGYGKVPIEAFFHGAIPVLSNVNLSSQIVGGTERGRCFPSEDATALAQVIRELADRPHEMVQLIANGREYARSLTLETWQQHIKEMLERAWDVDLDRNLSP